jgi:hypothetical protein
MIVKIVKLSYDLKKEIVVCIVLMAPLPARQYRKTKIVVINILLPAVYPL